MNGSNGDFRTYGLVRNGFQMPNTSVLDLRLSKVFDVAEKYHMEVMMNTFNVFNHQNVTGVSTTGYTVGGTSAAPTLTYNTGFGSVTNSGSNYAYSQRLMEFGARVFF
jgi:hypothetical protein